MLKQLRKRFAAKQQLQPGLSITRCTKFYKTLYVEGSHESQRVIAIRCHGALSVSSEINGRNFSAQILFSTEPNGQETIELEMKNGFASFSPIDQSRASNSSFFANKLWETFADHLQKKDQPKVLDIGGRDRSKIDRSKSLPGADVCVLDVLPSDNVDVVGDAHMMSSLFPAERFDAAYSIAVFEHLFMPWRVALEMNTVLKKGALGYVLTHQTLGMHDMPWDFWRYSDTAWDAIFNEYTGFRIIDRLLYSPSYILPFHLVENKLDAERSCGFEGSAVLVEKIGPTRVSWDVPPSIVTTMYPSN